MNVAAVAHSPLRAWPEPETVSRVLLLTTKRTPGTKLKTCVDQIRISGIRSINLTIVQHNPKSEQ
jgi:hypothetical protein